MLYWVANNSKFLTDKWRFDKTDPHCSVALSNFIAQSQLLTWGVRLREHTQKKNPIFIFKCVRVRVRLRESVHLRECVNTEFEWEVKRGFEKASVSKAVRLRECPLAES